MPEIEKLLHLAEQCQDRIDRIEVSKYQFAVLSILLLPAVAGIFVWLMERFGILSQRDWIPSMLLGLAVSALGYFVSAPTWLRLERTKKREARSLNAVMSILQELDSSMSSTWSPLERAEIRIRLSRLPIGKLSEKDNEVLQRYGFTRSPVERVAPVERVSN